MDFVVQGCWGQVAGGRNCKGGNKEANPKAANWWWIPLQVLTAGNPGKYAGRGESRQKHVPGRKAQKMEKQRF